MDATAELVKALQLATQLGAVGVEAAAAARSAIEEGRLPARANAVAEALGLPVEAFEAFLTLARTLPSTEADDAGDGLLGQLRDLRGRGPALPPVEGVTKTAGRESQVTIGVPEEVQLALSAPQNRVGRYVILSPIGHGGMGVVYRAWDPSLARIVALKMLRGEPDRVLRERFLREGRAAAGLRHPGIVAVHDVGEEGGLPYLAMDLLSGRTLSDAVAALPAGSVREAVALVRDVAEAVGHAHAHGIVHRDLKPENVLLDAGGRPVVTDFGLAKELKRDDAPLTQTGAVLGTPKYMSPEQAGGTGEVGPAGDVFSLGVMLYETLTGANPFEASTIPAILARVIEANPLPPRRIAGRVPVDLESVCLRALEKTASRRYADAKALAADLTRWISGDPVEARPITWSRQAVRFVRRHRGVTLIAAAAVAAAVTLFAVGAWKQARVETGLAEALMRARQAVYEARQARRVANHARLRSAAATAEREAGVAISLDPGSAAAHLERGRMKAFLGALEEARADLDRAVALDPSAAAARIERGRVLATLYRRGVERASSAFVVDRRIAPSSDAIEALDPSLRPLREAAEADLSSAEGASGSEAERELTRAYLAFVRRRWDEAIAATDRVLSVDLSEEACWLQGLSLLGKDMPAEALAPLDRAVQVGAGFGEAWLARAEAHFRNGEARGESSKVDIRDSLARSIADAERAQEEGADPAVARLRIAQALWKWGEENRIRGEPSQELYRRGIDLLEADPGRFGDVPCIYLRGALWDGLACALGKEPEKGVEAARRAIALIEQVWRQDPSYRGVRLRLGHSRIDLAFLLEAAGEDPRSAYEGAIEAYTLSIEDGDDVWSRLYRGSAAWNLAWRARRRGEDARAGLLAAIADIDAIHKAQPDFVTQDAWACWALVGLIDAESGKDALPSMARAEEEARRTLRSEPSFHPFLGLHGETLLLLARAEELAGRSTAATWERAAGEHRAALEGGVALADSILSAAHVECGLARIDRAAGRPWADRAASAFRALAKWRPCDGEGIWWQGEPYLAIPLAETLLDASVAPPEGWLDLARFLACAHTQHSWAKGADRLLELAFAALGRAHQADGFDAAALGEDKLLAPLRTDPRWAELAKPPK